MSTKDCGNHGGCKIKKLYRRILIGVGIFIILVLLAILITWLVLRPTKPRYYLQETIVYNLTLTEPNFLSTTMQVTIKSQNPNDRIGIYYDRLDVYAVYKGQQITIPTSLPLGYQGHDDIAIYSPYIYGTDVPLAPYLASVLIQDENAGYMLVNIRIDGNLRWKVGTWISGHYHIDVNCPAFLTVNNDNVGNGHGFHFQPIAACSVDV